MFEEACFLLEKSIAPFATEEGSVTAGPLDVTALSESLSPTFSISKGCFSFKLNSVAEVWLVDEAFFARSAAFFLRNSSS